MMLTLGLTKLAAKKTRKNVMHSVKKQKLIALENLKPTFKNKMIHL